MTKDNIKTTELCSTTIKAGHRVYFVDAKEDSRGNRYLALSECKSSPKGGGRDRQRIHIYEEDLVRVFEALGIALQGMGYDIALLPVRREGQPEATTPEDYTSPAGVNIPSLDDILSDDAQDL